MQNFITGEQHDVTSTRRERLIIRTSYARTREDEEGRAREEGGVENKKPRGDCSKADIAMRMMDVTIGRGEAPSGRSSRSRLGL